MASLAYWRFGQPFLVLRSISLLNVLHLRPPSPRVLFCHPPSRREAVRAGQPQVSRHEVSTVLRLNQPAREKSSSTLSSLGVSGLHIEIQHAIQKRATIAMVGRVGWVANRANRVAPISPNRAESRGAQQKPKSRITNKSSKTPVVLLEWSSDTE